MLQNKTNPWIGLDSYVEGQTIYGRDNEILSLTNWIINHKQTILCGRSGIGKTSILNAGVSPFLRRHSCFPVKIRLEHNSTPYINQIKKAVFAELSNIRTRKTTGISVERGEFHEVVPVINEEHETLWEFFHRYNYYDSLHNPIIPVIIFDQFEEIFTLEKDIKKIESFFIELADLLNEIMPEHVINNTRTTMEVHSKNVLGMVLNIPEIVNIQTHDYLKTSNFRIVITIREDSLSCLEQYIRNIPSLKQSKYFLQPINGEDAMSIIMRPKPGLINEDVALKIISTINKDSNIKLENLKDVQVDSAILSLCLSQLYINKPIQDETITQTLVDQFDNRIIDNFYTESIRDIPIDIIEYLEDNLVNDDCKRECISMFKTQKASIPKIYLTILTEERKLLRRFSRNGHMMIEYIHDILCPIVDQHKQLRRQSDKHKDADLTIREKIKALGRDII